MSQFNINHIKQSNLPELKCLAEEIRQFLIHKLSKIGGHLGPNLGTIELTIALHYVFESPNDQLIWDIGHQTYTHKMLTGRTHEFDSLRKYNGLSGFLRREDSPHDIWGAGHSSTSLSAAAGIAYAKQLNGDEHSVIPIIGDAAITSGMAFEALNHIGDAQLPVNIILNDNGMSISKSIGALQAIFEQGKEQAGIDSVASFFEQLGITYIGPIDGHDLFELIQVFQRIRIQKRPIICHILTQKGKGYEPAEADTKTHWHSTPPFDYDSGETLIKKEQVIHSQSWSEIISNELKQIAMTNEQLIVVTPAMIEGSKLASFKETFPHRLIDTGIAEQHAVTLTGGLAISGKIPFLAIYSTFLQRAYDQVVHDICRQNLHVIFGIDRAGLVGEDGDSHHGIFDINFLQSIPNMTIMMPYTAEESQWMLQLAIEELTGPVAIRYPKGTVKQLSASPPSRLKETFGTWSVMAEGKDAVIITFGPMLDIAIQAREFLQQEGIAVRIVNARFIKPLDQDMLNILINEDLPILTIEESALLGGFGSAVLEYIISNKKTVSRFNRMGIPDHFVTHGSREDLLEALSLTAHDIVANLKTLIEKGR